MEHAGSSPRRLNVVRIGSFDPQINVLIADSTLGSGLGRDLEKEFDSLSITEYIVLCRYTGVKPQLKDSVTGIAHFGFLKISLDTGDAESLKELETERSRATDFRL